MKNGRHHERNKGATTQTENTQQTNEQRKTAREKERNTYRKKGQT